MAFLIVSGSPRLVHQVGVEVVDQAEAVAAELQAVGAHAHAVLADVEGVLAPLRRAGVAVGHDHFGERGAIEDRAVAAVVAVAEVVQRQPFAGVEADRRSSSSASAPGCPFTSKLGPSGCVISSGLMSRALIRDAVGGVVACLGGSGQWPYSSTRITFIVLRSTTGRSPSIGRA